jgi:hypothetical protein
MITICNLCFRREKCPGKPWGERAESGNGAGTGYGENAGKSENTVKNPRTLFSADEGGKGGK